MLDNERNRTTTYRVYVVADDPLDCIITVYPQLVRHHPRSETTVTGNFRYDAIPKWMTDSMKMLDAAVVDGYANIPDFGVFSKDVYWFMADQTNPENHKPGGTK
jgi:hypothetical protein